MKDYGKSWYYLSFLGKICVFLSVYGPFTEKIRDSWKLMTFLAFSWEKLHLSHHINNFPEDTGKSWHFFCFSWKYSHFSHEGFTETIDISYSEIIQFSHHTLTLWYKWFMENHDSSCLTLQKILLFLTLWVLFP